MNENDILEEESPSLSAEPETASPGEYVPDQEAVKKGRSVLIAELLIAAVAIIVIMACIVIKKKETPAEPPAAVSADGETVVDNSELFENTPAIPSADEFNPTDTDFEKLLSEGEMLKLESEGITFYVSNYRDNAYLRSEVSVTDEEIESTIRTQIIEPYAEVKETDRTVAQMHDTVDINYVGTLDGVAFDGGTGSDPELIIGESAYIPGFTEGIVGMKVGETKDVPVTFPENYSEELAGKDAVFTITLNAIKGEKTYPELDDELASKASGGEITTAEGIRKEFRRQLLNQDLGEFLLGRFYVSELPAEEVTSNYNELLERYNESSQMNGMSVSSMCETYGITMDDLKGDIMHSAAENVYYSLLYRAIASDLGITITDEDREKIKEDYGYEGSMEDFVKEFGSLTIEDYAIQNRISEYFMDILE